MKKRNTGKKIAKYVVIAIILFVLLFPVYWMINCSLLPSNVIMSVPPLTSSFSVFLTSSS